jgi:hypothetical protein
MKHVKWEDCKLPHMAVSTNMRNPSDPITPGIRVSACYQGLTVVLEIAKQVKEGGYAATVLFFQPPTASSPSDLTVGDEVWIDVKHICASGL